LVTSYDLRPENRAAVFSKDINGVDK